MKRIKVAMPKKKTMAELSKRIHAAMKKLPKKGGILKLPRGTYVQE